MKQGPVVYRVVMFLLLGAILTYLGASAWQNLAGRMTTFFTYSYTMDDVAESTGFLVREEYVLPGRSELADVLPAEGERVAVGEQVAYLYRDAAALEQRREIRALGQELEQLTRTASSAGDLADGARLTEEMMTSLTDLRTDVASRDFTRLEEEALALKSLVYQRDYIYESGGGTEQLQALRVGQYRGGPGSDGVGGEPRAVCGRTRQRREQITGDDVPAAQRDAGDPQLPGLGTGWRRCANVVGQRAQRGSGGISGAQGRQRHGHDTVPGR